MINNRFVLIASGLSVVISLAAFLLQRKISLVYRLEIWQILLYTLIFLLLLVGGVILMSWVLDRQSKISRFGAEPRRQDDHLCLYLCPSGSDRIDCCHPAQPGGILRD